MPNKIFKKELSTGAKSKVSVKVSIKRGEKSWNYIYYTFGILLAVFSFVVGIVNVWWVYKALIFVIGLLFLYWLCFFNAWFQNKIIGFKIKLENTWR
jgi:hypothetical protein